MGGHGAGRRSSQQQQGATQAPPLLPTLPEVWPRLDPGAVLCVSSADLLRYQTWLEGLAGTSDVRPPNCQTVTQATPIKILDHDGPSRTRVVATDDSHQTGWTNAYLPAKTP
jgi:hypothetical protein